jgi:Tfp pilus assembly protein FimT
MASTSSGIIRQSDGFTLVDILAALVLLGILTSMAVPSMSAYVDQLRTKRALDQLVVDIGHARLMAVQQGRQVAVEVGSDGTYRVDTLSADGAWGTLKTVDLGQEYIGASFLDEVTLQFSSRGLLMNSSSNGLVRIELNEVRDSIFVSPAGRLYRDY